MPFHVDRLYLKELNHKMIQEENKLINLDHEKFNDVLLIIDDEVEVLNSLRRIFDRLYTVEIASNVKDAFKILEESNVYVIICDQRMPDMKGTEFFTSIKESYPDVMKILTTGYASLNDVIVGINEGDIYRYITKPWNVIELKASVRQAFEQMHLVQENKRMVEELKDINKKLEDKVRERTQEIYVKNKELEKLNHRLEDLAIHDSLTGLYNSRELESIYDQKLVAAKRLGLQLALVMIDLNDFKSVNDQLGHLAGDELLQNFAQVARLNTREDFDTLFRVGGDEFLILLLNCDEEHGKRVVSKIDADFKKYTDISSVSHGIVEIDIIQNKTLKEWMTIADKHMYSYKNRNRGDDNE